MKTDLAATVKKLLRRTSAACFAAVLLFGFFTSFPILVRADEPETVVTHLYHWNRVYTQDDIKDGHILLFWGGDDGYTYFTHGSKTGWRETFWWDYRMLPGDYTENYPYISPAANGFYTQYDMEGWGLTLQSGTDKKNGGAKKAKISLYDGTKIGWDGLDMSFSDGDALNFSLVTTDLNCDRAGKLSSGHIMIFREDSGNDDNEYLGPGGKSGTLELWESKKNFTDLSMFIATLEEWREIKYNMTVHAGTTLRLERGYILNEDYTITVEPGAVLSIDGEFICNGNILNYGTVIMEENAYVHPTVFEEGTRNESIVCYGPDDKLGSMAGCGNLLVLKNALLELSGGIGLNKGTSVVNNGSIILGTALSLTDAQYIQYGDGITYVGARLPYNHGRRQSFSIFKMNWTLWGVEILKVDPRILQIVTTGGVMTDNDVRSRIDADGAFYVYGMYMVYTSDTRYDCFHNSLW